MAIKYLGAIPLSSNAAIRTAAPWDDRSVVEFLSDLYTIPGAYKGMPISVTDETDTTKNGGYILMDVAYKNEVSARGWKIGGGGTVDLSAYDTATQVTDKVAAEATARANADTTLQENINALKISVEGNYAANFTIAIPAKKLLRDIVIDPTTAQTINIGTTAGGTDILNAEAVPVGGGTSNPFGFNKWFSAAGTLYITGLTADTYFKFFIV